MSERVVLTASGAILNLLAEHGVGTAEAGRLLSAISRASVSTGTQGGRRKPLLKADEIAAITDADREFHETTRRQALIHKLVLWARTCEGTCPLNRKKVRRDGDHAFLWVTLGQYLARGPALTKQERLARAKNEIIARRGGSYLGDGSEYDRNALRVNITATGSFERKTIDIGSIAHPSMTVQTRGGWGYGTSNHEIDLKVALPEIAMNEIERQCEITRAALYRERVNPSQRRYQTMTELLQNEAMPIERIIDWPAYAGAHRCYLMEVERTQEERTKLKVYVPRIQIEVTA